jgi:putative NIF3 family GTP cyclohydrolase 1 type 2
MPTTLVDLVQHCSGELHSDRFRDYCPNGLQVEGRPRVARLAAAVTASQAVLDAAVTGVRTPYWCTTVISGRAKMPW